MDSLYGCHTHSGSWNDLVKSHRRAYDRSHPVHLDPVIEQRSTDPVVVYVKLLLTHLMTAVRIILQEIKRREFETLKLLTVVETRQFLCHFRDDVFTTDHLYSLVIRNFHNCFGHIHRNICGNIRRFVDRSLRESRRLLYLCFCNFFMVNTFILGLLHRLISHLIFGAFSIPYRKVRLFILLTGKSEPSCKLLIRQDQPRDREDDKYKGCCNRADKIGHPCNHCRTGITAKTTTEKCIRPETGRHICKHQRCQESP